MNTWSRDELNKFGAAEEITIAPLGRDGKPRNPVTIWIVRVRDHLYVRSAYGGDSAWFRNAMLCHEGRIRAGGIEKDVTFLDGDPKINDVIDAAYRTKYRGHGAQYVNTMLTSEARAATIKLAPR